MDLRLRLPQCYRSSWQSSHSIRQNIMAPSSSPSGSQAEIISPPNLGNILTCLANVMIHRSLFHPHYPQFLPTQMVDLSLPQPPSPQALVLEAKLIEKYLSLKSAQQGELEREYRAACYVGNGIDTPTLDLPETRYHNISARSGHDRGCRGKSTGLFGGVSHFLCCCVYWDSFVPDWEILGRFWLRSFGIAYPEGQLGLAMNFFLFHSHWILLSWLRPSLS